MSLLMNVAHRYENRNTADYHALEQYEKQAADETRSAVAYLRQTQHLYVHGSMNVFSHETNVNQHKRFVVYNIKELGKNMQTLGMMIVLENLWDRVAKNRMRGIGTRIYVDERSTITITALRMKQSMRPARR